jgi:YesN/AraC family two-component response regulator
MHVRKKTHTTKIHVSNMVSKACKILVGEEMEQLGIHYHSIESGKLELDGDTTAQQLEQFARNISKYGMEIMHDNIAALADSIRTAVIEFVQLSDQIPRTRYSTYLSETLGYDYAYLSTVFSAVCNTTIQHFIIFNKIERAKVLISEGRHNLSEIAVILDYSSVAHLSSQFKKVTGLTPTKFKRAHGVGNEG